LTGDYKVSLGVVHRFFIGEKAKYAPISSGDHLRNKFLKQTTFGGEQSKGA
jgi:hypothetical protein